MTQNDIAGMMPGYEADMPAYKDILSEADVWAVHSFIESTWPVDIRERQQRSVGHRASNPRRGNPVVGLLPECPSASVHARLSRFQALDR
jgi:hypothetical protein